MSSKAFGLYQLRDPKTGVFFPTWYSRLDVPKAVRPHIGVSAFNRSTGETRYEKALKVAERRWGEWKAEIETARALGTGPIVTLDAAVAGIERWRFAKCAMAAGLAQEVAEADAASFRAVTLPRMVKAGVATIFELPPVDLGHEEDTGPVSGHALRWARAYFATERGKGADRGVGLPYQVGDLWRHLTAAFEQPKGWIEISGFDARFDEALMAVDVQGVVPQAVREAMRQPFARAWL